MKARAALSAALRISSDAEKLGETVWVAAAAGEGVAKAFSSTLPLDEARAFFLPAIPDAVGSRRGKT